MSRPESSQEETQLLSNILVDLDTCQSKNPVLKIEALRTVSRCMQHLLAVWKGENPDLRVAMTKWVDLLCTFREMQTKQSVADELYTPLSELEITDW